MMIKNLLEALVYLHSLGIIHMDIKLENVLMASNSNNYDIKLADFGISCFTDKLINNKCGTPGYMAPEVLDKSYITTKADVFSVGVIAYAVMTGVLPFNCWNLKATMEKNKNCDVKFTKKMKKSLSPQAIDFVSYLLEKDPAIRPTAQAALGHPWFNKTFKPEAEYITINSS